MFKGVWTWVSGRHDCTWLQHGTTRLETRERTPDGLASAHGGFLRAARQHSWKTAVLNTATGKIAGVGAKHMPCIGRCQVLQQRLAWRGLPAGRPARWARTRSALCRL